MKSYLRNLIVWLVLLAVPFTGFAAAAARCCPPGGAPAHAMQAATQHHDGGHGHHACKRHHGAGQQHGAQQDSQHDGKCSHCAACTVAMLAPPVFAPGAPVLPASHTIAFDAGHVPSVDPDHPERPPRFSRA